MADKQVKFGVIGLGNMGKGHMGNIDELPNATLYAVCDHDGEKANAFAKQYNAKAYTDASALLQESELDAVLIATPHYDHTPIAIQAFERGIHVLCEKPIAVHVNDAKLMIDAYHKAKKSNPSLKFGAMFNQRTAGHWKTVKDLIDAGELGKLTRTTWLITDWFRTQYYYDTGGWRATWKGEGGGVLTNQCPHNLDLYQWFVGMPNVISGHCALGKYHHIEVEDEVTAYFEHENGMIGHFVTTTAEAPGTNRLEIVGEQGKLIFENNVLTFYRNRSSMLEYLNTAQSGFSKPEHWKIEIPYTNPPGSQHRRVIDAFAESVLNDTPLVAEGEEGIHSVMMANAILLSHFEGKPLTMPIDGDAYSKKLDELVAGSTFQKNETVTAASSSDFAQSH